MEIEIYSFPYFNYMYMVDRWLVLVTLLPVLLPVYLSTLFAVNETFSWFDSELFWSYDDWLYAPFIFSLGIAYVETEGADFASFDPMYLLGLPLGIGMYWATHRFWCYYTDSVPKRGTQTVRQLAPGLLVPIPEELLFRQALTPLIGLAGTHVFVLTSSVVFGLYHYSLGRQEIVFKTCLGIVLCLAFLRTGSVLAPILIHAGYNAAWTVYVTDPLS